MSEQVRYGRGGTYLALAKDTSSAPFGNVSDLTADLTADPNLQDTALTYIRVNTHVNTDANHVQYTFLDENDNEINVHYRSVTVGTNSTKLVHRNTANTQIIPTYYTSGSDGTAYASKSMTTSHIWLKNMRSTSPVSRTHGYISTLHGGTNNTPYNADCGFMLTENVEPKALKVNSTGGTIQCAIYIYHLLANVVE